MGQILDDWLAKNGPRLSAMSGRPPPVMPGMEGAPAGIPPAFAGGGGGQAAPAFAQGAGPGMGPSFPAGDAQGPGPQPGFSPQAPVAAPVNVQGPPAKPAPTVAPKPQKKGEMQSFGDMYKDADPGQIKKAIDVLEQTTGQSVEQLYEKQTGNPPPRNTKREKIGEFLLEFGLNLMSSPAGEDSVSNVGRSLRAALATGRRREAQYAAGNVAA